MATLAPFGFQAGQSRRSVNEYYVPASDTNAYAVGDVVKTDGNVFTGRLPDSRVSSGMLHVTKAASGDAVRGVVVGIAASFGDNSAQSVPATKQRAYTLLVNDRPETLWDIQADNTSQLAVMGGMYANFTVGAPTGSVSSTRVASATLGTTVRDLMVTEVLRNDGANSLLRVAFVQHELAAAGGSPAIQAAIQALVSTPGNLAVASAGDSIAAFNLTAGQFDSRGSLNWALTFGGHQFDYQPSDQYAVSGVTSIHLRDVQLPLILAAMAAGRRYKYVWISIGTNDPSSGVTYDQTVAAITTVCEALRARGVLPLVRGISPRGADGSLTASKSQLLRTLAWMRTASLSGLFKLIDAGDIYADNSTARFNALAAVVQADLLHPNQRGASLEGRLIYEQVFANDPTPPMQFASSTADLFDRTLNPLGCIGSAAFNTTGTVSGSSAADPWFSSGAWTVASRTLPNGQTRNDPLFTVAAAGAYSELLIDISSGGLPWATTAVQPGDILEARARVRIAGAVKVSTLSLALGENNGSAEIQLGWLAKDGGDTSDLVLPDGDYWLRTPRTTIRAYNGSGSCILRSYLKVQSSGGGGAAGTVQVLGYEIRPIYTV